MGLTFGAGLMSAVPMLLIAGATAAERLLEAGPRVGHVVGGALILLAVLPHLSYAGPIAGVVRGTVLRLRGLDRADQVARDGR